MDPEFFLTADDFRNWLALHHGDTQELLVGFYKVGSRLQSITYQQALDQALCYGWIDGVRKSIDETAYMIRFTPRKTGSTWSAVNIKRARDLVAQGQMAAPGLRAFEARGDDESANYSYEQRHAATLDPEAETAFRGQRCSLGILPGAIPVIPPGRHLVGRQRQAARDQTETAPELDCGLRARAPDQSPQPGQDRRRPRRAGR